MKGTSSGEAVRGFPRLFKVLLFGFIAPRDAARTACGRRHAATWRSCGVLAAGRDSVPLAAAPMQKRMQLAPNSAHSPSMGCSWLALRDAARTACGRRRAATWRSCGVLAAGRDSEMRRGLRRELTPKSAWHVSRAGTSIIHPKFWVSRILAQLLSLSAISGN